MRSTFRVAACVGVPLSVGACASKSSSMSASAPEGQVVGTIDPKSKFARIELGMEMSQVHALIKAPDDMHRYESGKRRRIPFHFGSDARRIQTYHEGEGRLTCTGGNVFGGGGGELILIEVDSTRKCFEA